MPYFQDPCISLLSPGGEHVPGFVSQYGCLLHDATWPGRAPTQGLFSVPRAVASLAHEAGKDKGAETSGYSHMSSGCVSGQ